MTAASPALLEVAGLKLHFPLGGGFLGGRQGWCYAVDGLDFRIAPGETLGLVGEPRVNVLALNLALREAGK